MGYPHWVLLPEDEVSNIDNFYTSEEIRLDIETKHTILIEFHEAETDGRNKKTNFKMISDPRELYRFLATPGMEVANVIFASDDLVCVSWRFIAESLSLRHTNEIVEEFASAGARLRLYSYLDRLQEFSLYCDKIASCSSSREVNRC